MATDPCLPAPAYLSSPLCTCYDAPRSIDIVLVYKQQRNELAPAEPGNSRASIEQRQVAWLIFPRG